ncbi:1-aminocyclopropane-1-carboxylate deaminase/D-cysteine desulfhydrase [Kytococcus sedentarius]|uniref:1-aminocyclopropane-1-carboxylate deaminase/D-cysteine desulfhydrase n=1 Tax=Kytococcus sedentarius TaxID=1276 RepID=UPI00195219B1|nr:pyridoxal-phosphate dependent enzyme [Kytococcus sedentarius]QRO86719.1 pyridoxal-phosphate dependent enzyme [Kytococcus sedentarius]
MQVKRDDLLPFPAAGNKVRKLHSELQGVELRGRVLVTVGSVTSNHCRTAALMAAQRGGRAHLLLHGDLERSPGQRAALRLLAATGSTYEVVAPEQIRPRLDALLPELGDSAHFVYGGCHTPGGVRAYMEAAVELGDQLPTQPDWIVHATGTGATQAGLIAGVREMGWSTRVLGVSIAREAPRAEEAIREGLQWVGHGNAEVLVDDRHMAGGYGMADSRVHAAVADGWRRGMPLDNTYTGKAMAGLIANISTGFLTGQIVFWHTGGFLTHYSQLADDLKSYTQ